MVKLYDSGVYLLNGKELVADVQNISKTHGVNVAPSEAKKGTMAYDILKKHNTTSDMHNLQLKFDSMTSHDITYVGIIQTARASGMTEFPMPYVLTNCHNSLCAVGGTINEDDHMFAHSAAVKYGGIYVPTNMAVIHSYNREMMAGCGRMILGSDSHTRYGALGTLAVGEGGGELAKQLVGGTYDITMPEVIAIYLDGKPNLGVGPQDVALSIIGAVYANGYVKNKVMEFVGPGVKHLPMEYRNGIDVMTTETTCWSSIWTTDSKTSEYLTIHGRPQDYSEINPSDVAYYDGCVHVDLSKVECTIAMPMHPSYTYTIKELKENTKDILNLVQERANAQLPANAKMDLMSKYRNGDIYVDQGIVAGCAGGTFDNLCDVADILNGQSCGNGEFTMSVYPGSMPSYLELVKNGAISKIAGAGAIVRECFCGPCFGAGDTPANGEFSIRHTTRNFPNREGSKPGEGQISAVALMDARSIAATAINGGKLTAATEIDVNFTSPKFFFDKGVYDKRILNAYESPTAEKELKMGPNIKAWPEMTHLTENILLKVSSKIMDPVTTTDELIPSGETSSYRSNPLGLAEYTLSRRDPEYVRRTKLVNEMEKARVSTDENYENKELVEVFKKINTIAGNEEVKQNEVEIGSMIYAVKPGDGSAREQAASCQRVIGGLANICEEYATKRYRSNVINWGMLPLQMKEVPEFNVDDYIYIPSIKSALDGDMQDIKAYVIGDEIKEITLYMTGMSSEEREIIKAGSLINFNKNKLQSK